MNLFDLYNKALEIKELTHDEALFLYNEAPLSQLMFVADQIRRHHQSPENRNKVGWIIDRNVNITNACIAQCQFCNFHRKANAPDAFITQISEYKQKIEELFKLDGNQLLLQGGLHPNLKLDWYKELFSTLKKEFPTLKLHALGPAEIHHISKISKTTYRQTLEELMQAGLDSLPGAGAEILIDEVRHKISKYKCTATEWLEVMRQAHILNLPTSATMMFGHIETIHDRIDHLIKLRDLQTLKPQDSEGFITFIPWPYQDQNTELNLKLGIQNTVGSIEYIRTIAISRIILTNIKNIQASWLTVGKETAQICLSAGANDLGSIMIEENVVSAAGSNNKLNAEQMQLAIKQAGFIPARRNQKYIYLKN